MTTTDTVSLDELFAAGAHYGYKKARRHPSVADYIFGVKDGVEIFDLEKTQEKLQAAQEFVQGIAATGAQVLFVSGKPESKQVLRAAAEEVGAPFVAGRWIGGTLTNFAQIKKRVDRLQKLREEKEKGLWAQKYTKHEQLLLDREIEKLDGMFGGLVSMNKPPKAIFVIDPRHEDACIREARHLGIPVVALAGSDCDVSLVEHVIPANDTNIKSVSFFVEALKGAYKAGFEAAQKAAAKAPAAPTQS